MTEEQRQRKRETWMRWYWRNREAFIKRNRDYNKTKEGKESQKRREARQKLKFPEKRQAGQKVRNMIYGGKIQRQPCEVCGEKRVQAHHDDYSKPLDVRWLCIKHHKEHHARLKEALLSPKKSSTTSTEK